MWNIGEYVCFDGPHQNGSAQNRNISSKRPPGRSRHFFSLALRVNLARQAVLDVKSYLLGQNKSILASPQCGTLGNTYVLMVPIKTEVRRIAIFQVSVLQAALASFSVWRFESIWLVKRSLT